MGILSLGSFILYIYFGFLSRFMVFKTINNKQDSQLIGQLAFIMFVLSTSAILSDTVVEAIGLAMFWLSTVEFINIVKKIKGNERDFKTRFYRLMFYNLLMLVIGLSGNPNMDWDGVLYIIAIFVNLQLLALIYLLLFFAPIRGAKYFKVLLIILICSTTLSGIAIEISSFAIIMSYIVVLPWLAVPLWKYEKNKRVLNI